MKIESLNCPNCGAAVSSDSAQCRFCRSRLKTEACPSCFGLMFAGSRHCPGCGAKAVAACIEWEEKPRNCPRCRTKMNLLRIGETVLRECEKCGGLWSNAESFENLCADRERQSAVLSQLSRHQNEAARFGAVSYAPCPDCGELMNRSNFARASGIIIDSCKQHGVWFDSSELERIIEFIRAGGMERARAKEKVRLEEQRQNLREQEFKLAVERSRSSRTDDRDKPGTAIGEFLNFLFD